MREGKSLDKDLPSNAKTIELDEKEVLEALIVYIMREQGEPATDTTSQLEVIVFPNKKMRYLITYWPTN